MPCDVPRLLRQRFRGHGEDIAQRAMLSWLDPQRNEADLKRTYGAAPRDARLWLTSWPYRALAREAIANKLADTEPMTPKDAPSASTRGASNPVLFARTAAALSRLAIIDPAGYAMTIDLLRGAFHATAWRASLGATDVAINDRRALSLYRYVVLFFEVLAKIEPKASSAALRARRFVAGDPSDAAALSFTRDELRDKQLPISDWRTHYKAGVLASLELLADESALGSATMAQLAPSFRRVLRIDEKPSQETPSDDGLLAKLEAHAASAGMANADQHLAPDLIASLAAGDLQGPDVASLSHHFLTCRDRRCCAFLRWEVGGKEAVRRDLSGPMSEPPPGMSVTFTQGPSSQHLVDCRDVLWDAFTQMARAEGRSIDDLVNDAMARYRVIREYAAPPPPSRVPTGLAPTSSLPPRPGSRPPPSRASSVPPPPSRARPSAPPSEIEDEPTPAEGAVQRASKPPEAPVETRSPSIPPPARVTAPVAQPRAVETADVPGPPPVPEWAREPSTMRAPELVPPDLVPTTQMAPATMPPPQMPPQQMPPQQMPSQQMPPGQMPPEGPVPSRPIPRPLDSSRTLPGVSPPNETTKKLGTAPAEYVRTVELAPGILPQRNEVVPSAPAPRSEAFGRSDVIDEKLQALPSRSRDFEEAEDTSPKMNLSPLNPPLFVDYAGKRGHVNQARFVIGREQSTCHLVLPDSNVSRQHAVVEWHNGAYFLIDQGSTNGVGCGGHRIHRKQIVEGDRFDICGHTITFSFRL